MAFYELCLNCYLKIGTPIEVLDALLFMIAKDKPNIPNFIKNNRIELFNNKNWAMFLKDDVGQFPIVQNSDLKFRGDRYVLSIHSSFMDKDGKLIHLFLDFIKPYLFDINDFIGYYRMVCSNPVMIFYKDSEILINDL